MPDGLLDYSLPGAFYVCQGQSRQRRCEASFTYTEDSGIIQATIHRIFLATNVTKKLDHNSIQCNTELNTQETRNVPLQMAGLPCWSNWKQRKEWLTSERSTAMEFLIPLWRDIEIISKETIKTQKYYKISPCQSGNSGRGDTYKTIASVAGVLILSKKYSCCNQ